MLPPNLEFKLLALLKTLHRTITHGSLLVCCLWLFILPLQAWALPQPPNATSLAFQQKPESWDWAIKAAGQGNVTAQEQLALWHYFGTDVPRNYPAALKWLKRAMEGGSPLAREYFADLLLDGQGATSRIEQLRWLQFGAAKQYPLAMERLGEELLFGRDLPHNAPQALNYLIPLAEKGAAKAQYLLALAYLQGEGVSKDNKQAAKLLQSAADQNLVAAQEELAVLYTKGLGVEQNDATAISLLRQAGTQGGEKAESALWSLWQEERVVPVSAFEERNWLKAAAQAGNSEAQTRYGDVWYQQEGVAAHLTLLTCHRMAAFWYWKAARQGHSDAQYKLAQMFCQGNGVKRDLKMAWILASIAAQQDHPEAVTFRLKLSKELNAMELNQAQKELNNLTMANRN